MNAIEMSDPFLGMEALRSQLDNSLQLSDSSPVNGHTGKKVVEKTAATSVNGYLKKLQLIKCCLIENDLNQFKEVLKDIKPPDEVLHGVSKSQSSQIRLIIADLMHDSISMKDRESFIAGLAKVFDVNEQNKLGFIPLHLAVARGKLKVASILVKQGSQINLQNEQGRSPLHIAVLKGHSEVVRFLLSHEADPNLQDRELWTPLHWACRHHNLLIIRYLLTNGSRLDIKTDHGRSPLDMTFGANYNPSEIAWHPMSAWHLIVHGANQFSNDVFLRWFSAVLPQLNLSDEFRFVLSQLLVLMCKAGLLSTSIVESVGASGNYLKNEHLTEALYWCSKPTRLSQLCRIRVRTLLSSACGGKSIAASANELPLPKSVFHFVLLKK